MKRSDLSSWVSLGGRLVEGTFWVAIVAVVVVSALAVLGHKSA